MININKTVYKLLRWGVATALLAGGFLLAGCDRQQQGPPPRPVPEVSIITVKSEKVMLTSELPGRTSAFRIAEIRPQVSGIVQKRLFIEGSDVKAGQVLYEIDAAPLQAALDNALAALGRAESNLPALESRAERYKSLLSDKAVSQQAYDDASASLMQVKADIQYWKASVATARINLGYTKVRAPIFGRIGKSNVSDGAIATAYQPMALATIQQMDPIYADIAQSATDLLHLKKRLQDQRFNRHEKDQDKVRLIIEDGTSYPLEGELQFSDVTVDPTTGSVIMRVVFPNPEGMLLPGMFVRAVVKEGLNEQAVLIPQQGVSRDPKGNPYALIVNAESRTEIRMLRLDRAVKDKWLISEGLVPGDRVVVEGLKMLRPGALVKAVPFNKTLADKGAGTDAPSEQPGPGGK